MKNKIKQYKKGDLVKYANGEYGLVVYVNEEIEERISIYWFEEKYKSRYTVKVDDKYLTKVSQK